MSKKFNIEDNAEQLQQLCNVCKRSERCKNHAKLCTAKKLAWHIAQIKYKKTLGKEE